MTDKIQTLHPFGDLTTNVYPNIKTQNIPNGAITTAKMGFHLYENYVYIEWDNDPHFIAFKCVTTTPLANFDNIYSLFTTSDNVSITGVYEGETLFMMKKNNDTQFAIKSVDNGEYNIDFYQDRVSLTITQREIF